MEIGGIDLKKNFTIILALLMATFFFSANYTFAKPKPAKPKPTPATSPSAAPETPAPSPVAANPSATAADAIEALSRTRVYVEFYFMETGDYPENLEQLDKDLNSLLPDGMEQVKIPRDPITGLVFKYVPAKDRKTYALSVPDPSKYGVSTLDFSNVPWGGFAKIAEKRKNEFLLRNTLESLMAIATAVEYYAKDHKGKFPGKLKELIPDYIKTMPLCPATGKPFDYAVEGDNYKISSPSPDTFGKKEVLFSSSRGIVTK
jgi:hypothetical protein